MSAKTRADYIERWRRHVPTNLAESVFRDWLLHDGKFPSEREWEGKTDDERTKNQAHTSQGQFQ